MAATKGLIAFNTQDPLGKVAPIVKDRVAVVLGAIAEPVFDTHPDSRRSSLKDAESLEKFWWDDFEKLPTVKGQRVLYQCHALLSQRPHGKQ